MTTVRILEATVQVAYLIDDGKFPLRQLAKPRLLIASEVPALLESIEAERSALEAQMNEPKP